MQRDIAERGEARDIIAHVVGHALDVRVRIGEVNQMMAGVRAARHHALADRVTRDAVADGRDAPNGHVANRHARRRAGRQTVTRRAVPQEVHLRPRADLTARDAHEQLVRGGQRHVERFDFDVGAGGENKT